MGGLRLDHCMMGIMLRISSDDATEEKKIFEKKKKN